jgi:hypothetical protein
MLATTASRWCAPATTPFWTSITIKAVLGRSDSVLMTATSANGSCQTDLEFY